MIISYTGIELPEGKIKYDDPILNALAEKDSPKKVSPMFFEFLKEDFSHSFAIVIPKSNILDLLILDMEKIETRLSRSASDTEITILNKCMINLEKEIPLCDVEFDESEKYLLKELAPFSLKPIAVIKENEDVNTIIQLAIEKANHMFFYTSGPKESHAWFVPKGTEIISCAGKIHSDLERGFIKGDVVSYEEYINHHNFNECKTTGVSQTVEKDYIVKPNEIIEIRFNV